MCSDHFQSLLQQLTPLLLTRIGKREWSVYELTRFLSVGSETEDLMYNPISLRRKPPTMSLPEDIISEDEEDIPLSREIPPLIVDGEPVEQDLRKPEGNVEQTDDVKDTKDDEVGAAAAVVEGTFYTQYCLLLKNSNLSESIESKMRPWDTGSIDWMGIHQSDKIIERLMGLMKK